MKSFEHVLAFLTDPSDSTNFPLDSASKLMRLAKTFKSAVVIHRGGQSCNVLRLMSLFQMGLPHGDHITVTIEGEDEATVAPIVEEFFKANL